MSAYFGVNPDPQFDPTAIVQDCAESGADSILVEESALPTDLFDLSSGLAGELRHRLSIHRVQMTALVPNLTAHSSHFQAFALEANRGEMFRFLPTRREAVDWLESE